MCLIVLALDAHPDLSLAVAANRDEFHDRSCEAARFWESSPGLVAGRDLRAGGTWLGLTRSGLLAAVTNYREPGARRESGPSRGSLVARFLEGGHAPERYARILEREAPQYSGFSLLFGSTSDLWWFSNRSGGPAQPVGAGIHGLSNGLLDDPWPKVVRGRQGLAEVLEGTAEGREARAFELLGDRTPAKDAHLPATGLDRDLERALSAVFACSPRYGTRSSTFVTVSRAGLARFSERSFDAGGRETGRVRYDFALEAPLAR